MKAAVAISVFVGIAAIPLALKLAARLLVPATIGWHQVFLAAGLLSGLAVPLALCMDWVGLTGLNWWQASAWFAVAFWSPILLMQAFLRRTAIAPGGRALPLRAAGELSIWAVCSAVTVGVVAFGALSA